MKAFLIMVMALILGPTYALAGPMAFSGQDILALDDARFVNGSPDLGPDGSIIFAGRPVSTVLFELPLANLVSNPRDFSVAINLTRGTLDFDPNFLLSDGERLVGAQFGDRPTGLADFSRVLGDLNASGRAIEVGTRVQINEAGSAPLPAVGQAFDVEFDFKVFSDSIDITTRISGEAISLVHTDGFSELADLSLFFVSNSFGAETYQFNTFQFTSVEVPEPPVAFLLLMSLLFLQRRGFGQNFATQ